MVLDFDLAPRLGVETARLNQQVKRNIERFPADWAFQLTAEEFAALRSDLEDGAGHGGRRKPPWVYSEHGVVMAASVLKSPTAIQAMQFVVSVFVAANRTRSPMPKEPAKSVVSQALQPSDAANLSAKLRTTIARLIDSVAEDQPRLNLKNEALNVMHEAVDSIKERLKKAGVENDEIAARATKYLAEAEAAKAAAAKTRAETDRIDFDTLVRKLRLVMSAQLLLDSGDVQSFVGILTELEHTS